jgi:hypothetical protein
MEALYILIVPLIWLLSMKFILRTTFNFKELAISMVAVTVVVVAVIQLGKYGATQDTEVWNGRITAKDRVHDTYEQAYDCMCTTDSDGYETCSTCYETHYTVEWLAKSTVGKIQFKYLDSTWRSVYNEPNPARYVKCKVGEPASLEKSYTNYVQAVPQSLFNDNTENLEFAEKVPSYPRVFDLYRYNRVINVDSKISPAEIAELNRNLNNVLKYLGASKQANIIVILTEIDDPNYRYAVENNWLGGEKNDIVIFIGLDENNITWVDVMTWALNSGNEFFHVEMRDGIKKMKTFDVAQLTPFIAKTITEKYDRPEMIKYDYLADEIDPPVWALWLAVFLAIGISGFATYYFHKNEI